MGKAQLTDKEHILMGLLRRLVTPEYHEDSRTYKARQGMAYTTVHRKPEKGDLVICQSSGRNRAHSQAP